MNTAPSNTNLQLIGGIAALIVALGAGAYFMIFMTKPLPVTPTYQNYSSASIDALVKSGSVIDKVVPLRPVTAAEPAAVTYDPSDLGKIGFSLSQ